MTRRSPYIFARPPNGWPTCWRCSASSPGGCSGWRWLRIDDGHPVPGPPWDQLPSWSPLGLKGRALIQHRRHWLAAQHAIISLFD